MVKLLILAAILTGTSTRHVIRRRFYLNLKIKILNLIRKGSSSLKIKNCPKDSIFSIIKDFDILNSKMILKKVILPPNFLIKAKFLYLQHRIFLLF